MGQSGGPLFRRMVFQASMGEETLALIPGFSAPKTGARGAFLQVIGRDGSWFIPTRWRHSDRGRIRRPSGSGIRCSRRRARLHVEAPGLPCTGPSGTGSSPLPGAISWGRSRFAPGMECRHRVLSLGHSLSGRLRLNGRTCRLDGGTGYIEGDRGRSFPERYTWTQCNTFASRTAGVMLSAATIPYLGLHFTGCLASPRWDQGREIRLATYTGAGSLCVEPGRVVLERGGTRLEAALLEASAHPLMAPDTGRMAVPSMNTPAAPSGTAFSGTGTCAST